MASSEKNKSSTNYSYDVNYLFHTYATNEILVDTEDKFTMLTQPLNETSSKYAEKLMVKPLWCENVCEKYDSNEIFIVGLDNTKIESTNGYWTLR